MSIPEEKLKKILSMFLDELQDRMGNAGCNDLDPEMEKLLTTEEWIQVDKEFNEMNGSPEEHYPHRYLLMDYCVLYYVRNKLGV